MDIRRTGVAEHGLHTEGDGSLGMPRKCCLVCGTLGPFQGLLENKVAYKEFYGGQICRGRVLYSF